MTAPHRTALRALIVGDDRRPINSIDAADRILKAGWMPRPEPGSAEWEAMVKRALSAGNNVRVQTTFVTKAMMTAALRAALYPEGQGNG